MKWNEYELKLVEDHYYEIPLKELYDMMNGNHSLDAIQTKALRKFGYSKDRTWTNDELNVLKTYYSIESVDEVCYRLPKRTRQAIIRQANNLGIKSLLAINTYWSIYDEKLLYDNWNNMTDDELSILIGKDRKSILNKRWACGLLRFNHYNEASYESIIKYIRGNIGYWKSESIKNCDYQCVLTGSKDFHVHHLYSLSSIFNEMIEENNITLKDSFSDYSEEELSFILSKFIEKQSQYPLGVCIRKDLHNLFHKEYGKIVSPEMWFEFEDNFKKEKYVQIN